MHILQRIQFFVVIADDVVPETSTAAFFFCRLLIIEVFKEKLFVVQCLKEQFFYQGGKIVYSSEVI